MREVERVHGLLLAENREALDSAVASIVILSHSTEGLVQEALQGLMKDFGRGSVMWLAISVASLAKEQREAVQKSLEGG